MFEQDTKRVVVKVTRKHIMESKCGHVSKCAIAQAVVDAGFPRAAVGGGIGVSTKTGKHEYQLAPYGTNVYQQVTDFISRFDNEVVPDDYELDGRSKAEAKRLAAAAERKRRKAIEPIKLEFDVPVDVLKSVKYRKPSRTASTASKTKRSK